MNLVLQGRLYICKPAANNKRPALNWEHRTSVFTISHIICSCEAILFSALSFFQISFLHGKLIWSCFICITLQIIPKKILWWHPRCFWSVFSLAAGQVGSTLELFYIFTWKNHSNPVTFNSLLCCELMHSEKAPHGSTLDSVTGKSVNPATTLS